MILLVLDTATPQTVVALARCGVVLGERRHVPGPGERPGHVGEVLPLARELLEAGGLRFADVGRIGVGIGPGTFTGLRIGVATARALAQAARAELVGISTLEALAWPHRDRAVLACLDARRGEAFAATFRDGRRLLGPAAVAPEALAGQLSADAGPWLAVGDGAVRFRDRLEAADVQVPADDDPAHHVDGRALCTLAASCPPVARDGLLPEYARPPDATPRS